MHKNLHVLASSLFQQLSSHQDFVRNYICGKINSQFLGGVGNTRLYSLGLMLFSFLLFWICQYSDPLHGHSFVISLAVCCFIPWQKLILAYIHLSVVMLKNRYYYSGSKQRLGSYPVSNYFQLQKHHGNEFTSHSCELSPGLRRRVALPSSLLFQLSHFNLSSFLGLVLVSSHP